MLQREQLPATLTRGRDVDWADEVSSCVGQGLDRAAFLCT